MPTLVDDLFNAITEGDAHRITNLLTADPDLARARGPAGVSALLTALYHRKPAIAEKLRAAVGELDVFEAAALGDVDRLTALLDASPELVNAKAGDGFAPLHLACFFNQPQAAQLLVERGADVNAQADNPTRVRPLHSATAARSAEIVRRLLEAGADPDAQQQGGYTALHAVAAHDLRDIARLLRAHGADATVRTDDDKTAADMARDGGHSDIESLLE